jgi:hypothetical protein
MSAAASPPPAGLMDGIRRRHRRHLVRVGAGFAAVIVALALVTPPVTHALRSAFTGPGPANSRPVTRPSCPKVPDSIGCSRYVGPSAAASQQVCPVFCGPPSSPARAAPGTVLYGCESANGGEQEITGYRAQSIRAGPVWFVWARQKGQWAPSKPLGNGQVQANGVPVAVRAGATVVVRVAPAARSRFRFLSGFNTTDRYGPHAGTSGLTLAACPASYLGPVTVFWIGYLDRALSCVPFEVSVAGRQPVRVALSAYGGTCTA